LRINFSTNSPAVTGVAFAVVVVVSDKSKVAINDLVNFKASPSGVTQVVNQT
jgi:hypothetical protein